MALQRRGRINLSRHLQRAITRIAVLLAADLVAYGFVRAAIRVVRDDALLGRFMAHTSDAIIPKGYLSGWQYAVGLIVSLMATGNYRRNSGRRDPGRLFGAIALATVLPMWLPLWDRGVGLMLTQYVATLVLVWIGIVVERLTIDSAVQKVWPQGSRAVPALYIGARQACRIAMHARGFDQARDLRDVGYVMTDDAPLLDALGRIDELPKALHDSRAECVVICGSLADRDVQAVIEASFAAGCEVLALPLALEQAPRALMNGAVQPVFQLMLPQVRARGLVIKRAIDVIGAGIGLVLLSPFFLVIAALIKVDSRGPVLFRQRRVGYAGRTFGMFKFRTMRDGADQQKAELAHLNHTGDGRLFKIPNDPRITRVGAVLRRWSLDEVPQLINVLIGEMSLIGPRPFFPGDLESYELHHLDRLGARPGMTGLWQVKGRSSVMEFEEVVRLDREYIERWSLALDAKILFLTLPAVVRKTGAF